MKNFIKFICLLLMFLVSSNISFAKTSILNKIDITTSDNGYNINLYSDNNLKIENISKEKNAYVFEVSNVVLDKNFTTLYNANDIENIVVSIVSDNKIKIDVLGKNLSNIEVKNIYSNPLNHTNNFNYSYLYFALSLLFVAFAGYKIRQSYIEFQNNEIVKRFYYIPQFENKSRSIGFVTLPFKTSNNNKQSKKSKIA